MYRRFLADDAVVIRLVICDADNPTTTLQEKNALPNDPLYLMSKTSCPAPFNEKPMFEPWGGEDFEAFHIINFNNENHKVVTRFTVASETAREGFNPGSKPHGKHAAKNLGVSIMRAGRELDLDQGWIIQYDPVERWWGVEIEFPPALDDLFGVTNNKQAARNFSESRRLDLDTLLKDKTITQVKSELEADGDPRAQLLEIVHRVDTNIRSMRKWLQQQTRGNKISTTRHDPIEASPEIVATEATRQRQQEGHTGESDKDEQLPAAQRQTAIAQSLIDEGVTEKVANQLAATTVSDGLKYIFAEADLETPAFFSVKPRGGAIVITLNTNHPAYSHLLEVLDQQTDSNDIQLLQNRLNQAANGLKILLSAWARYEDEQRDQRTRTLAQNARFDWGRIANGFFVQED